VHPATRRVAKGYGAWAFALLTIAVLGNSFSGHGEYGISTHFWLILTGLPLSLLSLYILPNGSVLCVLAAGLIGTVQWAVVAEANARWEQWRRSGSPRHSPFPLSRARLRILWVVALAAPLVSGYALLSAFTYVGLNASGAWSADRASWWSSTAFALFCVFLVISVVAIGLLLRHYNHLPRFLDRDQVHNL
jgi:high-affinity Fe2+/Pb2+ permease